jgi:RNase P subunit RPR2
MFSIKYPQSRIKSSGQCSQCRTVVGEMQDTGRIILQDSSGKNVELLKWTCNYCGYTMLFDLNVARNVPFKGNGEQEEPID